MISKLSIKQKLIAIMLIPLVIVILLAAKLAYDSYRSLENLKSLDKVVILSTKIGALVHETQKERGMTAGFIGSKGEWDMEKLMSWDSDTLLDWGVEMNMDFDVDSSLSESSYTKKIEAPVYEPKREACPSESSLFDTSKCDALTKEIDDANISPEAKRFLKIAASRHIVFDYAEIAEYYAHAEKDVQALMERSALVIIDFEKAIENGYTRLKNDIYEVMLEDTDDEE